VTTIEMFDVDWMSGMSVGLFTLLSADVKTVNAELEKIMGDKNLGPLAGILRIIPIERLNALLVVTPQPHYLEQIKLWIGRLDKGGDSGGTRLFVYNVQNGRADKLAPLLTQAFTGRAPAPGPSAPTLAPGQTPATLASQPAGSGPLPAPARAAPAPAPAPVATQGLAVAKNVTIIADKDNNALLVMATPGEYSLIEAALKKLDVAPRQVMIDVTIAEIILTDDLSLGLQGYFKNGESFQGSLLTGTSTTLGTAVPGFSYLWKPGGALGALAPGGIVGTFNMLAKDSRVNIISRPNIMATDNQKAKIQVGDRVPTTSQTQTVSGTTTGIINSVQYLDTGILLEVTPHINAGGLIALELNTEVSSANKTDTSNIDSPTITKRSANTTVTVQSGETMIMGGLIREDKSNGSSGLPLISEIPLLGALFGSQTRTSKRTELVMFITPRLISSDQQLREVTEELRRKLEHLGDLIPKITAGAADPISIGAQGEVK
jgi:general secretion pathway protein D